MPFNRRQVLRHLAALPALSLAPGRIAFANPRENYQDHRLVVVFLRGAMDGLAVVPAIGDPRYREARNGLAIERPGLAGGALELDGFFALNPLLPTFHEAWRAREMSLVHAVASPYRERSHFDAQNLVENGSDAAYGQATGWLNRAILDLSHTGSAMGVSLTSSLPLIMRGEAEITSWSPSSLPEPDADLVARAQHLYLGHDRLYRHFLSARESHDSAIATDPSASKFVALMSAAARILRNDEGPRVAFTELGGWDSHVGQTAIHGPFWRAIRDLDAGLAEFRREIGGAAWQKTVLVFFTEFGRTVAMNGSNGTDHGTAGAALLVGGAVAGGKVHADWPGLRQRDLYEGRDLMPTTDIRALFKGLLREHLGVPDQHLDRHVFSGSEKLSPLSDLTIW